jgi:hypothetical protein
LLEGSFLRITQAKTELKNFDFSGSENLERAGDRFTEIDPLMLFRGIHGYGICQEIAEGTVFPF